MFMDFKVVFCGKIQTTGGGTEQKEAKTFDVSWL